MHTFAHCGVVVVMLVFAEIVYLQATVPARLARSIWAAGNTTASAPWDSYLPLIVSGDSTPSDGRPSWSAPLAVSPHDGTIWVANPDSGSISVIEPNSLTTVAEIAVGQEPWSVAIAPDGRSVYVVDRARGVLVVVDAQTYMLRGQLAIGPEPGGIALSPSGATAYLTLSAADEVAEVDMAQLAITNRVAVGRAPYALAITDDGDGTDGDEQIYVTHLYAFPRTAQPEATDDGRVGRVTLLDAKTLSLVKEIVLQPDMHGFPNMLAGVALGAGRAWLPHLRTAPALPNGLTTTVFAAVAALDLATQAEHTAAQLNLNDEITFGSPVNDPIAAIPAWDGKMLYVVLAGSDLVEVVDVTQIEQPRLIRFLPVGNNPRGMTLSPDGRRGYVMNFLGRSVTVLDLVEQRAIAQVPVTRETLDAQVLRGKVLFNSAAIPQMARVSWIACASCHADGGTDSVTWMFPDGPRQSPQLWNASRTLPWHWSAALDEPQDVEDTIQVIQRGLGLAPGTDPPLLGTPNAGRSADLDALAAFLDRGIRRPTVPTPQGDIQRGRQLFAATGCAGCHAGPEWTLSALPGAPGTLDPDGNGMVEGVLRDVGTHNPLDIRGATGFDVPSLLGVSLTAPYLHDGSLPTLQSLLQSGHAQPKEHKPPLTQADMAALVQFLQSIGPNTPPLPAQRGTHQ